MNFVVNGTAIIGDESESSPISLIPDMFDLTIQLNSLLPTGVEVVDLIIHLRDNFNQRSSTSTTAISNEQGVDTVMIPGEYQISDVNAEDFVV